MEQEISTVVAEVQTVRQDLQGLTYDLDAFHAYMRQELAKSQVAIRQSTQALNRRK
jgi:hypothetical protein